MDESEIDLAFLIGLNKALDLTLMTQKNYYERIYNTPSPFLKNLPTLLSSIGGVFGIANLSVFFSIPTYTLRLINTKINRLERCGRCLICDRYYSKIKVHLKSVHKVTTECAYVYMRMFSEKSYFYMPSEPIEFDQDYNLKGLVEIPPAIKKIKIDTSLERETKDYLCELCGKILPQTKKKEHVRGHKRNIIVECPICTVHVTKRNLKSHIDMCRHSQTELL